MKKNNTNIGITPAKKESERDKAVKALRRFYSSENAFGGSLDATIENECTAESLKLRLGSKNDRFTDVGILPGDIIIINPLVKDIAENDGLIASVVTNDRDFDDYLDVTFCKGFGSDDILDVEFLYEGDKQPKRRGKGDAPEIKREIIGLVTHIVRTVGGGK